MKQPRSLSLTALPVLGLVLVLGCRKTAPMTDDSLTAAVQTRLSGDSAISSEPVQSSVQNGIATLNGTVSSEAARTLAANDAAQVAGIKTVVNNLSVQTAVALPPPVVATPAPPIITPRPETRRDNPAPVARRRNSPAALPDNAQTTNQAAAVLPPPSAAPVVPPSPAAPPAPVVRNVTVPTGSILPVRITQTLDSATTQQGQSFSGTIASDVVIEGVTVLRQGAAVTGTVTAVQEAAHFKGNSLLSIQLTNLTRRGDQIALTTDPYSTEGKGRGKNTALKTGGGAAVGAVLGGIFGGGKGAAIGAGAGGGLGAGANAITRGEQVQIPAESLIRFRLASPITVRVSGADAGGNTSVTVPDPSDSGRRPLN